MLGTKGRKLAAAVRRRLLGRAGLREAVRVASLNAYLRAVELGLLGRRRRGRGGEARTTQSKDPRPRQGVSPVRLGSPAGRGAGGGDRGEAALPIVFIHRSNSDYLRYSLAQARASNPASTIYLLGDESNRGHEGIEHRSIDAYFDEAREFGKIYRHFNSTGVEAERFNFQRWFVLKHFLRETGLERCVYLDSDVLLYANVTEDRRKFEDFDLALSHLWCPCTLYLNRVEALEDFCAFVVDIFSRRNRYDFDRMVAQYALRRKNGLPGGACDMTAFQLFHEARFGAVGEVSLILDGAVYDPAIGIPAPGLEMDGEIKRIVWRDGKPFGVHQRTGREVRLSSLHCQGRHKWRMAELCTAAAPARVAAGAKA
jgi:hypothetical protein